MNAMHSPQPMIDRGTLGLAAVVSIAAALVAVTMASLFSRPVLIVAIIVVASVIGWVNAFRLDPPRPRPIPVRVPVRARRR